MKFKTSSSATSGCSPTAARKTSLAEAMLFKLRDDNRLGKVEEGSTISILSRGSQADDLDSVVALPFEWKGNKVNLIDSPGYFDFGGETDRPGAGSMVRSSSSTPSLASRWVPSLCGNMRRIFTATVGVRQQD